MKIVKRALSAFLYSSVISMICLLLIEAISGAMGHRVSPLTPEFIAYFPSETIAMEVDILLYGIFGMAFGGMSYIFEIDRIGFVVQNIIYFITTALVWIPIVTFIWQLWKYKEAFVYTIVGFVLSYIIVTVCNYAHTMKEVEDVNKALVENKQ